MRRGFLNTPRKSTSQSKIRPGESSREHTREDSGTTPPHTEKTKAASEPPLVGHTDKGKGKEKERSPIDVHPSEDSDCTLAILPPRPLPMRAGWGRSPDEAFFHTVPSSHGGPDKKRAVFRFWPRDPNGKPLVKSNRSLGTLSPDGYPWGATLYDFYYVHPVMNEPDAATAVMVVTGSTLTAVMKELGEVDIAATEIEWAESEGEPREEGAADTEALIKAVEGRMHMMAQQTLSMNKKDKGESEEHDDDEEDGGREKQEEGGAEEEGREGNDDDDDDEVMDHPCIPPPPTIPVTSPFHSSHYPKPWPSIPFENSTSILLQERIPLHLLPETLYVHDPFCLLPAREQCFRNPPSWTSRPDIIRTYNLRFSSSVCKEIEEARKRAEELEEFKARTLITLKHKRTEAQIANGGLMLDIPLPPYPRRMTKVEESHLYLSPASKVGTGNHSIVYKGEWELPRNLFARPKICLECFMEAAYKEIQRLKDTGQWEMLIAAGSDTESCMDLKLPNIGLDAARNPLMAEIDEEIIEREVICTVPPGLASPSRLLELLDDANIWNRLMENKDKNIWQLSFAEPKESDEDKRKRKSAEESMITIRINPPFTYESQKNCTHDRQNSRSVPRTAKFTVVAKLSIEDDAHLVGEARNYQQFPEHFFRHYNGYSLIRQLHTIVPVHAVVPQFYGYYTPKEDTGEGQRGEQYLSPILLLEHCGEPIDPEELTEEDHDECASLLLRFQRAGWLHGSVAPRNFLAQRGKPTVFPLEREINPELSFRLIDFGRSRKYETVEEKRREELVAMDMLDKLMGKMNQTLGM